MSGDLPGYIVIEGPIGVGKTSLARRLSEDFGTELLLEGPEENPFLERFYQDPRAGALPTQLFFLMQRVRQMQALRQGDMFRPVRIADFLIEKDRLFAGLTLDADELALYEQVYQQMTIDAPVPDLVVYLQAPVDVLLRRIAGRGRRYEQTIDSAYLQRLCDAYTEFFYHYNDAPLLIVNASEIDLVNREPDYQALLEQIRTQRSGRHYFNPLPFAM
ncbi:MAG: deoxynucleoside kinase [Gammaproteobacteria bacterium]|nr:deoxynucleoside kinase [Gammaproteobacteria bacterium]MDX5374184.1 deoxynucleoside kinase [Gammaproteobacteria bacterium]